MKAVNRSALARLGLVAVVAAGFAAGFEVRPAPAAAPYPLFAMVFTESEWQEMKECLIQQGRLEIIRQLKPDAPY